VVVSNRPCVIRLGGAGVLPGATDRLQRQYPEGVSTFPYSRREAYANAPIGPLYPYTNWAGAAATIQRRLTRGHRGRLVL
jgi:hypothetical protein